MMERILRFFGLTTLAHAARRYLDGINTERARQIESREHIKLVEMQSLVGKAVIGVSNEWENPLIGTVIKLEMITRANQPIPVVRCAVTGKEFITFCKVMPFTMQRFEALMKLNPYERWCLVDNQNEFEHRHLQSTMPDLFTYQDYMKVLTRNGFFNPKPSDTPD